MKFYYDKQTLSGLVRGRQVEDYLGSCHPDFLRTANVDVYVKADVASDEAGKVKLVDLIDCDTSVYKVSNVSGFIVSNEIAKEYVSRRTDKPIYVIPHHHCNFEKTLRNRSAVETVGYIGDVGRLSLNPEILDNKLSKYGLRFVTFFNLRSRDDVVEALMSIDINLVFDDTQPKPSFPPELKNPLKVINASSFGIPTVGYRELCYKDMKMVEASTMYDVVVGCLALKKESVYDSLSRMCLEQSKDYHISNVVKKYIEYFGDK